MSNTLPKTFTASDFLRALERAVELEPGSIQGTEALTDLEWWDSLAALTFMAVADQELQVIVSGDQLVNCRSVPDLLGLLGDRISR
jgi:acyl carrier protein